MSEQFKKVFILGKDWNGIEINPNNNLQYRWTSEKSTIYIKNEKEYIFLKVRIYNGTTIFKERILNIFTDGELCGKYKFLKNTGYLDIKIDIKDKKEISFCTENAWCPSKINSSSMDFRLLGFKIYSFLIDSESSIDNLVPISLLVNENSEECFIDSTQYVYNVSKITSNPSDTIFYVGQYGTSGYASAAKGYIYKYFEDGMSIKWHPLRFDDSILSKDCPYNIVVESTITAEHEYYDTFIYHSTPDLWSVFNSQFHTMNFGKKRIGYAVWETTKLPDKWVISINSQVDEVWCPSTYNFEVFKNSGVTIPIKIVPHIFLKRQLIPKKNVVLEEINGNNISIKDDVYTFYSIGEFNERKGMADLLKVYCDTFKKNDKVRLIIKSHYKDYSPHNKQYCLNKINDIVKNYPNPPEIHYIIDNLKENDILALHSLGDCYISLTKSEAFGMTIFDAFNYKKDIITTNYSGMVDYIPIGYEGLVNYKLDVVDNMKDFSSNYSEDTVWAYPDLKYAAELMKAKII
jgi:glycosyltransferase involved in cell wall biosynthesis